MVRVLFKTRIGFCSLLVGGVLFNSVNAGFDAGAVVAAVGGTTTAVENVVSGIGGVTKGVSVVSDGVKAATKVATTAMEYAGKTNTLLSNLNTITGGRLGESDLFRKYATFADGVDPYLGLVEELSNPRRDSLLTLNKFNVEHGGGENRGHQIVAARNIMGELYPRNASLDESRRVETNRKLAARNVVFDSLTMADSQREQLVSSRKLTTHIFEGIGSANKDNMMDHSAANNAYNHQIVSELQRLCAIQLQILKLLSTITLEVRGLDVKDIAAAKKAAEQSK